MIGEWFENTITGIASHRVMLVADATATAFAGSGTEPATGQQTGIQNTHRFNDHLLTEANDGHHTHDQDQRQNRTRRWCHTQLVRHEAFNCIGDCHAINQQDRVDSEEVEQGNQFTCANTKCSSTTSVMSSPGFYQTVRSESGRGEQKCHRERKDSHDDQRDHTANTGVDWQEQHAAPIAVP